MTSHERRNRAPHDQRGSDLEAELANTDDAGQLVALAAEPVVPSAALRSRLLASIARPTALAGFRDRLARIFELPTEGMQTVIDRLNGSDAEWETLQPGVRLFHFDGGPALASADCGFVSVDPGVAFPTHRHEGREISIILSGAAEMDDGTILRPGDIDAQEKGSTHGFRAHGDAPLLFAAFLYGGLQEIA